MGGQQRKVVKAKRSTDTALAEQKKKEAVRKKDADIFKASLKKKSQTQGAADGEDNESDWESVEEDYPGVKLSELLDGLTLEAPNMEEDDEDDAEYEANARAAAANQGPAVGSRSAVVV